MRFNTLLGIIAVACSTQLVHAIDWGTICSEPNFGGDCTTYQSDTVNKCVNFTGKDSFWNDKISSLSVTAAPSRPVDRCTFFVDDQCSGKSFTFQAGRYDTIRADLDNQFSSFKCST